MGTEKERETETARETDQEIVTELEKEQENESNLLPAGGLERGAYGNEKAKQSQIPPAFTDTDALRLSILLTHSFLNTLSIFLTNTLSLEHNVHLSPETHCLSLCLTHSLFNTLPMSG